MSKRNFTTLSNAEREARDLRRMAALNEWPRWPWLPMKRFRNGDMECALMHADHAIPPDRPRVYHTNLYEVGYFPAPDTKFDEFENLDSIIAAGWQID